MRSGHLLASAGASYAAAASSLADVCTSAYAVSALPSNDVLPGITIDASSVVVAASYNVSSAGNDFYPGDVIYDFCSVTFAYTHNGTDDSVLVQYWLPTPAKFQNRFLATGGGGYAINSGNESLPGGVIYGAAAGITDAGFGAFTNEFDSVFPLSNGTVNWPATYMFGYQAIHEMTVLGKQFTQNFFETNSTKIYSYYQGCSEGGRDGLSQVQRFADELDGAIIGAPAIRFAFQQVQHFFSNIAEQTLKYYPPPCEMSKILNLTIAKCDGLDGRIDGVVSRNDLCHLHLDLDTLVGEPYYCAASGPVTSFPPAPAAPEQNGTVSAEAINLAKTILAGLKDSKGKQVYLSYTMSSTWTDALTQYNNETDEFELWQNSFGAEFVERYLLLQNASYLPTVDFMTYDILRDYIVQGWEMYADSLHTTWPDLTPFHEAGGKILHFHGESDFSIPTGSSVRYHESVRKIMYPGMSYNESNAQLNEWYKLYLVDGAQHCGPNVFEPNGPFPQTNLAVMIDWVEKGVAPTTLNATVLQGEFIGENRQICQWPLRPLWENNGTELTCVYDQASIDTWHYDLDSFKIPVY